MFFNMFLMGMRNSLGTVRFSFSFFLFLRCVEKIFTNNGKFLVLFFSSFSKTIHRPSEYLNSRELIAIRFPQCKWFHLSLWLKQFRFGSFHFRSLDTSNKWLCLEFLFLSLFIAFVEKKEEKKSQIYIMHVHARLRTYILHFF